MRLLGAVLAGGRASRFGSDKALACLGEKALIDHAIEALRAQTRQVVVCGRPYPPVVSLADRPHAHLGPLGGLAAALCYAAENHFDAVLSVGCDTPCLPHDLAQRLAGPEAAIIVDAPIIGFWPTRLAPALDDHLRDGADRSMRRWAEVAGARPVSIACHLPNINTMEDLHALQAERRQRRSGSRRNRDDAHQGA